MMADLETFELVEPHPDVSVQEAEYRRLLGYPTDHGLEGRPRELADWAAQWYRKNGRPWVYTRYPGGVEVVGNRFRLQGASFASKHLQAQLQFAAADDAVVAAVSAGRECEELARQLWRDGKPDEYFFMEMFGSAVVEHLVTIANGHICGWADRNGLAVLPHFSPGYAGWDISEQTKFWQVIRSGANGRIPGELDVMSSGMLRPRKSLLAFFGITRDLAKARRFQHLVPCENCSLNACQYRRAPYHRALPQTEEVRRFQSTGLLNGSENGPSASALKAGARYTVNSRALRKWARERLQLATLADGSVTARFRYEGTTCSNLGVPLEFDYHVRLGSSKERYKILEAHCVPAPGDTGHTQMCEYLSNADSLMKSIADEKPLLGRPLDDVLTWKRPYCPSGCYCDADRRIHKWAIVFEVIHFALRQHEHTDADSRQDATLVEYTAAQS